MLELGSELKNNNYFFELVWVPNRKSKKQKRIKP